MGGRCVIGLAGEGRSRGHGICSRGGSNGELLLLGEVAKATILHGLASSSPLICVLVARGVIWSLCSLASLHRRCCSCSLSSSGRSVLGRCQSRRCGGWGQRRPAICRMGMLLNLRDVGRHRRCERLGYGSG